MAKRHMCRIARFFGVACLIGVLLVGLSGAAAAQKKKVKMGIQPFISYVPIFAALANGYFTEQGLDVTTQRFISAQKMMPLVAGGVLDVVGGALSAAFYNGIAKGLKMKIVADKGRWSKGHSITQLLARKDLYDSGAIKSAADLKGRVIHNNAPLTGPAYLLAMALKAAGGRYDHSKLKYLAIPKIYQAFKSKAIEVGTCVEPWCSRAVREGLAVSILKGDDLPSTTDFQIAYVIYTDKFIQENPDAAQRFMNAYMKGVRFYHDSGERSDAVAKVIGKFTKLPAAVVKAAVPVGIAKDGLPNMKSVADFQNWLFDSGFIKKKLNIDDLWDPSFVRKAAKM